MAAVVWPLRFLLSGFSFGVVVISSPRLLGLLAGVTGAAAQAGPKCPIAHRQKPYRLRFAIGSVHLYGYGLLVTIARAQTLGPRHSGLASVLHGAVCVEFPRDSDRLRPG
jgi:hypothetical protein